MEKLEDVGMSRWYHFLLYSERSWSSFHLEEGVVHIIEYILYSNVDNISSKHCNYSGRVNWVEGIKRSIGSFNQISIQRIWKTTPKFQFTLLCYNSNRKAGNIIIQTTPKIPSQIMSIDQQSL
jgi:hypothetical protein